MSGWLGSVAVTDGAVVAERNVVDDDDDRTVSIMGEEEVKADVVVIAAPLRKRHRLNRRQDSMFLFI